MLDAYQLPSETILTFLAAIYHFTRFKFILAYYFTSIVLVRLTLIIVIWIWWSRMTKKVLELWMMIISLMTLGLIQLIVMAVIMSGILLDIMNRYLFFSIAQVCQSIFFALFEAKLSYIFFLHFVEYLWLCCMPIALVPMLTKGIVCNSLLNELWCYSSTS